ncbi:tautomerase family protein [Neobacillus niacini]|uniref:tautomerase family protein n=2 Tax=Bacillaceae TaxID=186817 RepID=UPI0005EDDBE1|nr:tautomerase family protein [Neobacillus niacini]
MPVIQMTLVQGRDNEVIETCIKNVARTVAESLNAPIESVRVIVNEVPANRFAVGTLLKSEKGKGENTCDCSI